MAQKLRNSSVKPALLDQKFWQNFAKNHWEKKPLHLKNVKSKLLEMGEDEIFKLLVRFSDRCREQHNPEGFKFYIDGFKAEPEDVLQVLPEKTDNTLAGYHARMQALFPDYCLVCDELLQVNVEKQHLLTEFTEALYQHVGFPNRFSEMGLYLGNYRKTPFGVHVDSCGVFSFPVAGVKTFRLWPAGYGQKNPRLDRSFKYDKYKKDSQVLQAGPGDMTYWPSSAWHIAESDGSFSATWSLGVWVDQPHKELVSESLHEILSRKMGAAGLAPTTLFKKLHSSKGEVSELPEAFGQAMTMLQNLTAAELQEAFLKNWMKHISMQGFKTIPQVKFKLTAKSPLKLRSEKSLILWQPSLTNKSKFYFSFGGTLGESSSRSLLKLIKALNAGETCRPLDHLSSKIFKTEFKSLQALAQAGAFTQGNHILT